MGSWHGWRAWLAAHLPWYDAALERRRDASSERTVRRGEVARARGERVIAEYEAAAKVAGRTGEALIEEVRRDDK